MKSIKEIVEEIMQSGFDVAMGGDAFLSEEENKTAQEIKYDEFVKIYTNKIRKLISRSIKKRDEELKINENTSDGYHTFKELYEFRKVYNEVLFNEWFKQGKYNVHKSWRHNDFELCFGGGWFIVMADLPTGQISNHYEAKDWELFQCEERDIADKWDGHTAQDVVKRLLDTISNKQDKPI